MKSWFGLFLKKRRLSHGQPSTPLTSLALAKAYPVHRVAFLDQLQTKAVIFTASFVKIFTALLSSIYAASWSCNLFFPRRARQGIVSPLRSRCCRPGTLRIPSTSRPVLAGKSDSNLGGDPAQARASLIPTPPGEKLLCV
jgi:hypothetical protein